MKKVISILLILSMLFAMCACEKKPSAQAGTEEQQALTQKGREYVIECFANTNKEWSVKFEDSCYMYQTTEPVDYYYNESSVAFEGIVTRILYIWVIQDTIPMYTVVYFDEDGNMGQYTYLYDEMIEAEAEAKAESDAYYEVMKDKLIEMYTGQYQEMNETLIPFEDSELSQWTELDISHLN